MKRESNIELLRIIAMFMIVLHHYCVNAGFNEVMDLHRITANTILIQFMSLGGKVGVNIFFLISGFFMVNSAMKWEKVYKLLAQIIFYNIIVYVFLTLLGYNYGTKDYLDIIPLIFSMPVSFIGSYLVIYILSPIINKTLKSLNRKEFHLLLGVLLFYFVILQSFFKQNTWHYLGWAFTMYCVGSYIKSYDIKNIKLPYGKLSFLITLIIWGGILLVDFIGVKYGIDKWEFFIYDANKFTVFILGVTLFLFFLNTHITYNKFINRIGGAAFGILLLHANNDIMRQWLWKDFLNNTSYYDHPYLWLHMLISVIGVYAVCTVVELLRQEFIEKKIFSEVKKTSKQNSQVYP